MKIGIISDLHFEWLDQYDSGKITRKMISHIMKQCDLYKIDILFNAGDTHTIKGRLQEINNEFMSSEFGYLSVYGNHDFYGPSGVSLTDTPFPAQLWIQNGVKILRGTLWTNFRNNAHTALIASRSISDFRAIPDISPQYMIDRYVEFNEKIVEISPEILLTHFAVNDSLIAPKFIGDNLNGYFVNDMEKVIFENNIKLAVYGHTHDRTIKERHGVWYVNNAFGYPNENYSYIEDYNVVVLDYDDGNVRIVAS